MMSAGNETSMLPSQALAIGRELHAQSIDATTLPTSSTQATWTLLPGELNLLFPRQLPCQILPFSTPCRLPQSQHYLLGAIAVQGFVTPVFDWQGACDLTSHDTFKYLIVFGVEEQRIALASNTLPVRITAEQLQPLQALPPLPPLVQHSTQKCYFADKMYFLELAAQRFFEHLADSAFTPSQSARA